jgi:ferrous iron transport protein A
MSVNPLSLKPGEKGIIRQLNDSHVTTKLLEMGFLPGKEIRLVRKALGGCPLYIDLQGNFIALRKEEAETILLEAGNP